VYNTTQSLGLFVGGGAGGWLMQNQGQVPVFVLGVVLIVLWGISAAGMRVPKRARKHGADKLAGASLGNEPAR
jgi:hypothetical protein